jgi:type II secretory pathway predicted ATPase ExeA
MDPQWAAPPAVDTCLVSSDASRGRRGGTLIDERVLELAVHEAHTVPIIVLDEAQHLSDAFLADLSGFLNFAFDTRSAAALWLVGLPSLAQRLRLQVHAPLASRITAQVQLAALERDDFKGLVEHGLKAAGTREKLLTDAALELLFRASRGIPRIASRLLRAALKEAHARNQNLVDDAALKAAVETLALAEEVRS